MSRRKVAAGATSLAVLASLGAAAAAHASATDVGAITSNAQEFASDSVSNAGASDNISCSTPEAYGTALVQATNAVVAQVFGEDEAVAHIVCASLTPSLHYTITGTVYIQAYINGSWQTVASSPTKTSSSTEGAAAQVLTATGTYDPPSAALGTYHRAKAVYTLSTGRVYRIVSPSVWFMKQ